MIGGVAPAPMTSEDPPPRVRRRVLAADRAIAALIRGGALATALLPIGIAVVLFLGSRQAIDRFGLSFLVSSEWDPLAGEFGALPTIVGTVVSSLVALALAVPVSVGTAIVLARLAPRRIAGAIAFVLDVLAAVPSIAYGFWGSAVLVPLLQHDIEPALKATLGRVPGIGRLFSGPAYGFGMLAAGMVLAIMILPVITAVAREVLRTVPRELEEGAYALGATWWQATRVVIGAARGGLLGAVLLGFARAVGETMAVTMVIGNRNALDLSLFAPTQTMASLLANEFLEADKPIYVSSLTYLALVLLLATLVMNGVARWLISSTNRPSVDRADHDPSAWSARADVAGSAGRTAGMPTHVDGAPLRAGRPLIPALVVDRAMRAACGACAVLVVAVLGCVVAYVVAHGVAGFDWDLLTRLPGPPDERIGLRNGIVGTCLLAALASVIGVPIGLSCGIYLSEFAGSSRVGEALRLIVDVLAGIPSIVVGVVVYDLVVRSSGHYSGWAGALALAVLMVPVVARVSEEMLRLVPRSLREGSLALAATRAQTIVRVILPAASAGVLTGVLLAVARVAGETAPLLFTALGYDGDAYDPAKPYPALTLKIFQYATSAEPHWRDQAWAGLLLLVALVLVINVALRVIVARRGR